MSSDISWNLTQHAKVITESQFIPFLKLASKYEGSSEFQKELNKEIALEGILTANNRDGQSDSWRDYQQVLATLGVIVSTRVSKNLIITPLGKNVLEGLISFEELATIQSLRMQYPNGNTTQNDIWIHQHSVGMQVKPAVLLIDILIQLTKTPTIDPIIYIDECQQAIVSSKDHNIDVNSIVKLRNSTFKGATLNQHARRNLQDWYKFLGETRLFKIGRNGRRQFVELTNFAIDNIDFLEGLCADAANGINFWLPTTFKNEDKFDWFQYYGSLPLEESNMIETHFSRDDIESSSPKDLDKCFYRSIDTANNINLGDVASSLRIINEESNQASNKKIKSGQALRDKAYNLHEKIILELTLAFEKISFECSADPNSIDLYAKNNDIDIILEVKTTTPKNIIKQLRLAVGQILEYKYRIAVLQSFPIIVISSIVAEDFYYIDLLKSMGISLICWNGNEFISYTSDSSLEHYLQLLKDEL